MVFCVSVQSFKSQMMTKMLQSNALTTDIWDNFWKSSTLNCNRSLSYAKKGQVLALVLNKSWDSGVTKDEQLLKFLHLCGKLDRNMVKMHFTIHLNLAWPLSEIH